MSICGEGLPDYAFFLLQTFILQGKRRNTLFLGEVFRESGGYQFKAKEMKRTLLGKGRFRACS